MAYFLALLSSAVWGTADFFGGTLSRRANPLAVVGGTQSIAFLVILPAVLLTGAWHPPGRYLLWSLLAGAVGMTSLVAFYAALAVGTMGVVAPIAATGVVVPVVLGLVNGERPHVIQLLGIGFAVAGVVLASGPEVRGVEQGQARGGARALVLAALSALGFGLVLWFLGKAGAHGVGMTLLGQRVMSTTLMLVALCVFRNFGGLRPRDLPQLAGIGIGDLTANGFYVAATTRGLISVVAVLGSLYPVATVLLARMHGERLRPVQNVGVVTALLGVVLIAAG